MITLFGFILIVGFSLLIIVGVDKYIIPRLNPESRIVKQWKSWFVDEDPYL
jgi:hypothetical protein